MKTSPKNTFEVRALPEADGGGFLVTFPDLPGCMADGASIEEAITEALDAEASWLATRRELDIQDASGKFMVRIPRSLHIRLQNRAKQEGVSMNTLAVNFLSEGIARHGASHN